MTEQPPKRILERLERTGNKFAWVEKLKVDWGHDEEITYRAGVPPGVHILPILENGNVLLVHQYRLFSWGWGYEIPGGMIERTDSEESAALRELEEEAGYRAGTLQKLCSFYPSPIMLEQSALYAATNLTKTKQHLDRGEAGLTVTELTPTQLQTMILDGTIKDSQTIIAFFLAREQGLIKPKKGVENHPF